MRGGLYYGVGICDLPTVINKTTAPYYRAWNNMLMRCYDKKYSKIHTTYIGCSVCDEWLKLSNFKPWFDVNYIQGYCLDKDFLVLGNKVYGPDRCLYIPQILNTVFADAGTLRTTTKIGAHFDVTRNKFQAHMRNGKRRLFLGRYDTEDEAHSIWLVTKRNHIKNIADELLLTGKITEEIYSLVMIRRDTLE